MYFITAGCLVKLPLIIGLVSIPLLFKFFKIFFFSLRYLVFNNSGNPNHEGFRYLSGITKYTNDGLNSGPYNIDVPDNSSGMLEYIINPETNRKVKVESDLGQRIIEKYVNFRR